LPVFQQLHAVFQGGLLAQWTRRQGRDETLQRPRLELIVARQRNRQRLRCFWRRTHARQHLENRRRQVIGALDAEERLTPDDRNWQRLRLRDRRCWPQIPFGGERFQRLIRRARIG
jgi:hypothetical protein